MKEVSGKIILIDDGSFEKTFLEESLDIKNWNIKVEYFNRAQQALDHLNENADEIFLIISDMNMPEMSGMELKMKIDQDPFLRQKSIPFIFWSSNIEKGQIEAAYKYRVQGYFKKPDSINKHSEMIEKIVLYWQLSIHPNAKFSPAHFSENER